MDHLPPETRKRISSLGGRGRAVSLPPARRSQIASHAALKRWAKVRRQVGQHPTIPIEGLPKDDMPTSLEE